MLGAALNPLNFAAVKLFNRVLADYPLARGRLVPYAGRAIAVDVGPLAFRLRITADGESEMVGEGLDCPPDVTFTIAPALLPRLLQKDESAFSQVQFSGDSEFASLLSTLARNIEWDIEEDLSRLVGDIAAHRIAGTARGAYHWQQDARQRFTENVAEYLTEERRAFITRGDLETLSRANEDLRDDVARLEARLNRLKT